MIVTHRIYYDANYHGFIRQGEWQSGLLGVIMSKGERKAEKKGRKVGEKDARTTGT